jgi:hypothetical protein
MMFFAVRLRHSLEVPVTFPLPRSRVNKPSVWTRKSPSLWLFQGFIVIVRRALCEFLR